jgi:hypothetical protein
MAVHSGHGCRVMVGDVTLRYVHEVSIEAPIDGVVTLTLRIIGGFSYTDDGVFRIEGIAPKVDESPNRGISFTGVPPTMW